MLFNYIEVLAGSSPVATRLFLSKFNYSDDRLFSLANPGGVNTSNDDGSGDEGLRNTRV